MGPLRLFSAMKPGPKKWALYGCAPVFSSTQSKNSITGPQAVYQFAYYVKNKLSQHQGCHNFLTVFPEINVKNPEFAQKIRRLHFKKSGEKSKNFGQIGHAKPCFLASMR